VCSNDSDANGKADTENVEDEEYVNEDMFELVDISDLTDLPLEKEPKYQQEDANYFKKGATFEMISMSCSGSSPAQGRH
jgi:hypothetical protein